MYVLRAAAAAIASVSVFAATPAAAAEGWYLSLEGGGSWVQEWDHTRTLETLCGPVVKEAVAEFDTGYAVFGAAGFSMSHWRLELEGGYRENGVEASVLRWGKVRHDGDGDLRQISAMLNVLYDIPLFDKFALSVGLGLGADHVNLDLDTGWGPVDVSEWRFNYQGIAGVTYALTSTASIFANYRYANAGDNEFQAAPNYALAGDEFQRHAATAGVRFALATPDTIPPPPPAASPPPVPLEREFMVFFGFNKANLTKQALATIKDAVGAVHKSGSAAIRVVGHADRAGSVSYNKALSVRRAKSVKEALIAEGIDGGTISVSGRGESEPMVKTNDGIREPQNRRVHISF